MHANRRLFQQLKNEDSPFTIASAKRIKGLELEMLVLRILYSHLDLPINQDVGAVKTIGGAFLLLKSWMGRINQAVI